MAKQIKRDSAPAMTALTDEQWQDPDLWEDDGWVVEGHDPPLTAQAVVFEASDMDRVRRAAEASGVTVSEFIRRSAIDAASV